MIARQVKAISVRQPWAWLLIHGPKDVENRTWAPWGGYRGPLVIVASKGLTRAEYEDVSWMVDKLAELPPFGKLERGGVIGAVDLYDVSPPSKKPVSPWHFEEQFAWRVRRPVPLPFRPFKGALGLRPFELSEAEHATLLTAWGDAGTALACGKAP
jgi:hypothetical protein